MDKNQIQDIINSCKSALDYEEAYTKTYKLFALRAIENLLNDEKFVSYLTTNSRSGGYQNKMFKEYCSLVEQSLPLHLNISKKQVEIKSLLDPNLNMFDGISEFNGIVFDDTVKNGTTEFYIGGRSASYSQPFFIGKLLDIIDINNKSLMTDVVDYSFSKIKLSNIKNGTLVKVMHLRVVPHYQMGAMSYINRIRKKIVSQIITK